jgi:hypothetical protein
MVHALDRAATVICQRNLMEEDKIGNMGAVRYAYKTWSENLYGRDGFEDLGLDERILLKLILNKWYNRKWTGVIWPRMWTNDRFL